MFNPLNAELNPICHLLTLLGAHHILHVSWVRVKRVAKARTAIARPAHTVRTAANTGESTEYVKSGRLRWAGHVARMGKEFD